MNHFHNKKDLDDNDVKYIVVAPGQKYRLHFLSADTNFEGQIIQQGIKFWLNRCQILIDNQVVPSDRVIVWYSQEKRKPKVAGGHYHYYSDQVTIEIGHTIDDKPNLGVFNVWTIDNKRCYELTDHSSITDKVVSNKTLYQARHGFSKGNAATIEFHLEQLK